MNWIDVTKQKPEHKQKVLCLYNNGDMDTAYFSEGSRKFRDVCCGNKMWLVTPWIPLPAPPSND